MAGQSHPFHDIGYRAGPTTVASSNPAKILTGHVRVRSHKVTLQDVTRPPSLHVRRAAPNKRKPPQQLPSIPHLQPLAPLQTPAVTSPSHRVTSQALFSSHPNSCIMCGTPRRQGRRFSGRLSTAAQAASAETWQAGANRRLCNERGSIAIPLRCGGGASRTTLHHNCVCVGGPL